MQSVYEALQTEIEFLELVSHYWSFLTFDYHDLPTGKSDFAGIHVIEPVFCHSHGFVLGIKCKAATRTKLRSGYKALKYFEFLES